MTAASYYRRLCLYPWIRRAMRVDKVDTRLSAQSKGARLIVR
nr:MAG TPA_asm: hypothetical protein [Caudoviricetes sp.]